MIPKKKRLNSLKYLRNTLQKVEVSLWGRKKVPAGADVGAPYFYDGPGIVMSFGPT